MLRTYDIVVINADVEDEEIRGQQGYIISEVTTDQIGVFIYDLERVWCLHPSDVKATGENDDAACRNRGSPIRVNSKGEIIG